MPNTIGDRASLDPFVESFFSIEFSTDSLNTAKAYFHSISGGEMEITLIEHNLVYQSGSSTTLYIPGPSTFHPITISQGVTSDKAFWNWWTDVTMGKKRRKTATIKAYAYHGTTTTSERKVLTEDAIASGFDFAQYGTGVTDTTTLGDYFERNATIAEWTLENCWPLKISGFKFNLDSAKAFFAEIKLVAESITRER